MNRALQRTIFVGCKELGLDDDARRDLQLAACGKASMRDMTDGDMRKVVDRLKASGFGVKKTGRKPAAPRADLRLCHVLWRLLGEADLLKRPGRDGLNAFVRSRFGETWGSVPADIDMLRDHKKIAAIVEALKAMCASNGVKLSR